MSLLFKIHALLSLSQKIQIFINNSYKTLFTLFLNKPKQKRRNTIKQSTTFRCVPLVLLDSPSYGTLRSKVCKFIKKKN